jgi:heme oxygenase
MSAVGVVLGHLRLATAQHHQQLEDDLQVVERLSSSADRRAIVLRYYQMHAVADAALGVWLGDMAELDYTSRRRTPLLLNDLQVLGLTAPPLPDPGALTIAGRTEALGVLYVLEGSALGGRVIRKALMARGQDHAGLGFLDPYGDQTGDRWTSFISVLERVGVRDVAGVARGGLMGFAHARACLVDRAMAD